MFLGVHIYSTSLTGYQPIYYITGTGIADYIVWFGAMYNFMITSTLYVPISNYATHIVGILKVTLYHKNWLLSKSGAYHVAHLLGVVEAILSPSCVIAKDVKSCTYCCYAICATSIVWVGGIPWPQTGATQYHSHLGSDKDLDIKGLVVCNDWDIEPLYSTC